SDTIVDAKLNWIRGSVFPAAPSTLFLSLCSGMPFSDGSGVVELTPRVAVTYAAPASPSGDSGWPHTHGIVPTADVAFTPPGTQAPGLKAAGTAFALWSASSGGTPLYVGALAWWLLVGVATTLAASDFRITAQEPT